MSPEFTGQKVGAMPGLIYRTLFYAAAWWVLSAGAADSWLVGVPIIAAAVYVNAVLSRPSAVGFSPVGLLFYGLYFIKFSITGGIDVLCRAYHPRVPLEPGLVSYPLKLASLPARQLFVCTVSLLPGTLAVQLEGQDLKVHVLDVSGPFIRELAVIESKVAAIFTPRAARARAAASAPRSAATSGGMSV